MYQERIDDLEKTVAIKNKYLEAKMHNEDVTDPNNTMNSNLAQRAAEKIRELRNTIEMLMQSKEKDGNGHDC